MKVVFYVEKGGGVLAVFPYEPSGTSGRNMTCYAHFGQHGSVRPEYLRGCRLASPEEYSDLKHELEQIGYDDLEVLARLPRNAGAVRVKEWERLKSFPQI